MSIYLALGSNEGDRLENLEFGIAELVKSGFRLLNVSPVVETPAMLPENADPAWNKPFLNVCIQGDADWSPETGLKTAKIIEEKAGRQQSARWSPRPLDIDLIYWNGESRDSADLTIPHAGALSRDFVLTPLLYLNADLKLGKSSVFDCSQNLLPIPAWMAIVNVTPDSFSDGNSWFDENLLDLHIDKLVASNVQVIDVGAESTRPRADSVSHDEEWSRLEPVLKLVQEKFKSRYIKPKVSIDSRNPETIEAALKIGVDILNDVTGLEDERMRKLVKESGLPVVAMHSLTVPVDPTVLLPNDKSALVQMDAWIEQHLDKWEDEGIDRKQVIIDPGIGFGKSSIQTYEILKNYKNMRRHGCRILIGHSRKSFMNGFCKEPVSERDIETIGMSMALCQQGVDIIRVHDPLNHMRAYRAWMHVAR